MKDEFIKELAALLKKHNACISFSVGDCSDTHGLYDEKMVVTRRPDPKSFEEETLLEVSGWSLAAYDLEDSE